MFRPLPWERLLSLLLGEKEGPIAKKWEDEGYLLLRYTEGAGVLTV